MTGRLALACVFVGLVADGCQQTLVLDDLSQDAGRTVKGGAGGSGSGGRSDGGPSDASSDVRCHGNRLVYTPDVGQILVAIDKSSTMGTSFGGGPSRFQAALNAVQSDVARYNGHNGRASIQFAFLDFPDSAADCNAANGCCSSDVTTIYNDFQNANTCNNSGPNACFQLTTRPTAAALDEAITYFTMLGSSAGHGGERFVLLITDGDPQGTCPSNNSIDACSAAIAKVGTLNGTLGVTTEVVAIVSSAPCLTELANSQGGVFPSPYYLASIPNDLPTAVDQIASAAAQSACRLTLTSPPQSNQVTVFLGNTLEPQDNGTTGNGWTYGGDNTRIVLHGSLCQSFLQGSPNNGAFPLQIFDCPPRSGSSP